MDLSDRTHAYIGRSKCGHVNAVVVDDPKFPRDTANTVAEWMRGGMTIERMEIEAARKALEFCDCRKAERRSKKKG